MCSYRSLIINQIPLRVLDEKTPHEMLFKQQPNLSTLKSFGSLCYVTTISTNKDKFMSKDEPCIFVGYHFGTKGTKS